MYEIERTKVECTKVEEAALYLNSTRLSRNLRSLSHESSTSGRCLISNRLCKSSERGSFFRNIEFHLFYLSSFDYSTRFED